MILQVDGATRGRRGQIDAVLRQKILVSAHPNGQGIRIVRWDDGHIYKFPPFSYFDNEVNYIEFKLYLILYHHQSMTVCLQEGRRVLEGKVPRC